MTDLRRDIQFKSYDGITLRGWFYPGHGRSRAPVIVMSHGVSLPYPLASYHELQDCMPRLKPLLIGAADNSYPPLKNSSSTIMPTVSRRQGSRCSFTIIAAGAPATVFHEMRQTRGARLKTSTLASGTQ